MGRAAEVAQPAESAAAAAAAAAAAETNTTRPTRQPTNPKRQPETPANQISGDQVQLLVQAPAGDDQHRGDLLMLQEPHRQQAEPRPMSAGDNNEQDRWRAEQRQQQQQHQRDLLQLMRQRLAQQQQQQQQRPQHTGAELPTLQQLQQRRRLQQASAGQRQQSRAPEMEQQLSGAGRDAKGPILSSPRLSQPPASRQDMSQDISRDTGRDIGQVSTVDDLLSAAREPTPVPRPRAAPTPTPTSHIAETTAELSILTSPQHPRLRDIGAAGNQSPASSVLSDSTTLITEAAMHSAELIPKLIERLDRKLVVMKDEQLSLMREMELNEATGRRLFAQIRRHLTVGEFDKISLHADEIEKVTKLILSLKLRLKRVEAELKDRSTGATVRASQPPPPPPAPSQPLMKTAPPQTTTRGVSDPTSTIGLPKRNHQHHASLQLPQQQQQQQQQPQPQPQPQTAKLMTTTANTTTIGSLTSSAGSSPISSPRGPPAHHQQQQQQLHLHREEEEEAAAADAKTASTSSDSIFNCADSAIGSTITGHGGSATNIMGAGAPKQGHSSLVSTTSSSSSSSSSSPGSQRLSSSQSSMASSSVPSSPPLASPSNRRGPNDNNNNGSHCGQVTSSGEAQDSMVHLLSDIDILMAKRNKLISQLEEAHQLEECIVHRNNIIIQRILKKYFKEPTNEHDLEASAAAAAAGNEIEDFRQFTRLKSLLLKDTHDIAERIDNAELQLTELKQTNPQ